MTMRLSIIEFGSLLSYSPRGWSREAQESRTTKNALKSDEYVSDPPVLMSDWIADIISRDLAKLPFARFFKANPILVPVPSSSLRKPGTLWVPERLTKALVRSGLGKAAEECLKRSIPVRKSATSYGADRPKPIEHYNSMAVQKVFPEPEEILLVDDIVTRGATLLGAANRLIDAFPKARIRAFAAMRTISTPEEFCDIYDPCTGDIQFGGNDSFRSP